MDASIENEHEQKVGKIMKTEPQGFSLDVETHIP
jgi:hypothetical protein